MNAVRNNRPGVYNAGGLITLMPGLNKIDSPEKVEAWDKAKKIEAVALRLEPSSLYPQGELQEVDYKESVKRVRKTPTVVSEPTIKGLNRKDAIAVVEKIDDITLLKSLKEQTGDSHVKGAINNRIEELEDDDDD